MSILQKIGQMANRISRDSRSAIKEVTKGWNEQAKKNKVCRFMLNDKEVATLVNPDKTEVYDKCVELSRVHQIKSSDKLIILANWE